MSRRFFLLFIVTIFPLLSYAQPKLKMEPEKIEFKNDFDRLKNVFFINEGTDTLSIDSIYYNNYNFYFLRFDVDSHYPIYIAPGDTIKMDCILSNYYYIPSKDTLNNMLIYSNGLNPVENLSISIDYFEDNGGWGTILGNITENSSPAAGAQVYILHNGSRVAQTAFTNSSGFFSVVVPSGIYTVAAKKDSFYTTFYGQTFSPYSSKLIRLSGHDTANVSMVLSKMAETGLSICGQVMDSLSQSPLQKAIIIVRKGGHTPSKISSVQIDSMPTNIYSAVINPDGTYEINNITEPGYYIIQSFSDYYVPSYFKSSDFSTPFWETADSIYINADICGYSIFLPRDSSVGGGIISGNVAINQGAGNNFSDVIVFAQSIDNYAIFNHTIVEDNGNFIINDLPYGHYRLVAEKIGYTTVYSYQLTIDPSHNSINNVEINFDIAGITSDEITPDSPVLYQNYPNPFNPSTNIEFFLPKSSNTDLKIVNILGEEVKTLYKGFLSPGNYKFRFDAGIYSSGVYFVILNTNESRLVKKIILLK
jgi:Secretion system C-terminal sorting domain/Carboxypeptidase regulatory-like domain